MAFQANASGEAPSFHTSEIICSPGQRRGAEVVGAERYKIYRWTAPAMWQGPTTRLLWALLTGAMTTSRYSRMVKVPVELNG